MSEQPRFNIGDRVRLVTTDGFNGSEGIVDSIGFGTPIRRDGVNTMAPGSEEGNWYHVFFGICYGSRKVVPFKSHEVEAIESGES